MVHDVNLNIVVILRLCKLRLKLLDLLTQNFVFLLEAHVLCLQLHHGIRLRQRRLSGANIHSLLIGRGSLDLGGFFLLFPLYLSRSFVSLILLELETLLTYVFSGCDLSVGVLTHNRKQLILGEEREATLHLDVVFHGS